jgi:CRP/FNR family transcriptional regulator, cyclic AMP receptor protein
MTRLPTVQHAIADISRQTGNRFRRPSTRNHGRNGERLLVDPATKIGYLSETHVFASLPAAEHKWLAENTTMVTCERGRVFYTPDERGEVVFILKRGKVDLYRISPDGRKLVVSTVGPKSIFGEMGLIGQGMYGCYAEASEKCLLCVLSRADLQALIHRNPGVGLNLMAEMGNRLLAREADLEALAFRSLPARLADLLLREADPYGTVAGLSHQDLAERLGTYRETVSQLLGKFRSERLVAIEPRRIKLIDPEGLQIYAEA